MDNYAYTIERARLKALKHRRDKLKEEGETDSYADACRDVRTSEKRIQEMLRQR